MPDIRQQVVVRDDFDRANEDPLSFSGKWSQTDSGVFYPMVVVGNQATHKAGQTSSDSYWNSETFDGDEAEVWGLATGGNASGIAWGLGLFQDVGGPDTIDGYRFRLEVGVSGPYFMLYRFANGASTAIDGPTGGGNSAGGHALLRRNGNEVEGWFSYTSWNDLSLVVSATDTNYTTGLYFSIGIRDNSASQILGWDYVGGGGRRNRPQIYRWIKN